MKRILNLGCGNDPRVAGPDQSVVNHDRRKHRSEIDVVHDLNDLPWPWADNSFDHIVANAVLEHLNIDLVQSMNECWRILAPGGTIELRLPWWKHDNAYRDPTHRWHISMGTLDLFDPDTEFGSQYAFYTDCKWRITVKPHLNVRKSTVLATLVVRK